jgi:hypothetical protein
VTLERNADDGTMEAMDRPAAVKHDSVPASWSQRYKVNPERLSSGDRGQIAEVVRQLSERERASRLTPGASRMLARARTMLDGPGGDPAGVRDPPQPLPPGGVAGLDLAELEPYRAHDRI